MRTQGILRTGTVTGALLLLGACASLEEMVDTPRVTLRNVHVQKLDLSEQTFLLSFDVANPNPFPLPVRSVSYEVKLDALRFASGEASSDFTIPAGSDGEFAISVDLNLLQTAPELLFTVREGVRDAIPYSLEGTLALDLPAIRPVRFESSGLIQLQTVASYR